MSEREDNVYKAKLAEQAERYDGEYIFMINLYVLEWKFLCIFRRQLKDDLVLVWKNSKPRPLADL